MGAAIKIFNTDDRPRGLNIDDSTGGLAILDYGHHEVHAGSAYHAEVSSADLGAETGDHIQITLKTPDTTKQIHMIADAYGSGEILFSMREAPTGGNVGTTALVPFNKNRNSDGETVCTKVYQATTVGTGGKLLVNSYVGAGKDKIGGASRGRSEWILKRNTVYTFRVYAVAAITAYLLLDWYEHTPKN